MQRHAQVGIEVRMVRVLLQENVNSALMTVFFGRRWWIIDRVSLQHFESRVRNAILKIRTFEWICTHRLVSSYWYKCELHSEWRCFIAFWVATVKSSASLRHNGLCPLLSIYVLFHCICHSPLASIITFQFPAIAKSFILCLASVH